MATKTKAPVKEEAPERTQLIINQKKVDKYNTICTRIEFTPAVCEICGFDVISTNELEPYWDMEAEMQEKVKDALAKHVEEAHGQSSQHLVYADEMPESWLGKAREDKKREKAEKFG
jgi:hypothetical protein